jgi:hypothetical protein
MQAPLNRSEDKPRCIIISPIGQPNSAVRLHADMVLHSIIKPALPDFDVKRGDDLGAAEMISGKMIEAICDSELAVADLTAHNPNVLYELGLRHMVERPVIHIAAEGTKLPFDTAGAGIFHYNIADIHSHMRLRVDIAKAAALVLARGYKVSNPVTAAREAFKLRQSSGSNDVMLGQMRTQIADMERRVPNGEPTALSLLTSLAADTLTAQASVSDEHFQERHEELMTTLEMIKTWNARTRPRN